jgi:hypothetical protein
MKAWLATVALVTLAAGPAWGDAVIERYSRSDGVAGLGGFESTTVETISASAQREEARFKFTGSVLGAIQKMAGFGDQVRITRLDRDLVWTLDPEKRTYTEEPLTPRGERQRMLPGQRPPRERAEPSDLAVTRNEFKVEKTGAQKAINGFPCEEYLMTWLVETRDQKTGETGKSLMTNRLWTTPETAEIRAVQAEEQAYAQAYLTKLGLQMSPAEAQRFLAGLTGLSEEEQQKALARLGSELGKIQGYTIASQLEWTAEASGGAGSSRGAGGGRSGGQPGLGEMMGQLGRLLGGGARKGGGEGEPSRTGPGGPIFGFYTEVRSLRTLPADGTRFEVPAGFTRK